jgi:two-component system CheB/CheR fusion protein
MFAQVEIDGPVRQGMGIGLSLIKQLAELHGGRIRLVRSEVGKGSAFEVRLPLG